MPFLNFLSGGLLHARVQQAYASRDAALFGKTAGLESLQKQPSARHTVSTSGPLACAAPGCSGGWIKSRRTKGRPFFENGWACSAGCLRSLVRGAVRREAGDATMNQECEPHHHRVPLGLVLLAQGWITHAQLQTALQSQRASGRGRIGEWLMEGGALSADRITRGVSLQWSCPVLGLESFSPSAMALVLPASLAAEAGVVPVRTAGTSVLYIGFRSEMNAAIALALEKMSGLRVESGLLTEKNADYAAAATRQANPVPVYSAQVPDTDALCTKITGSIEARQPVASRLVRIQQTYWLRLWLESDARAGVGELPPSPEDVEDYLFTVTQH